MNSISIEPRAPGAIDRILIFVKKWRSSTNDKRRRVLEAQAEARAVARAQIRGTLDEWLDMLDQLASAEPEGWTEPTYAKKLIEERRHFEKLFRIQEQLRRNALPRRNY